MRQPQHISTVIDHAPISLYNDAMHARIKKVLTPGNGNTNGLQQSSKKRQSRNEMFSRNT